MNLRSLCVFCGSSTGNNRRYSAEAAALGQFLAARRIALIYGGSAVGLMGVLADSVLAAGGYVTGVIPRALVDREVEHRGIQDLRVVASMHERKQSMASLADAFLALPGGFGTLEEFFEVVTWSQLGLHRKACALLNVAGYFDPLLQFLDHAVREGFLKTENRELILSGGDATELIGRLATVHIPQVEKWIKPGEA